MPEPPHPPPSSEADATDPAEPSLTQVVSGESQAGAFPRGTVLGRYFVAGMVGEGGMASVYLAYDPELDRRVAIKLLFRHAGSTASDSFAQRFARERELLLARAHACKGGGTPS